MNANAKSLTEALRVCSRLNGRIRSLPVLSYALLDAAACRLTATDLEVAVSVPVEAGPSGSVLLPVKATLAVLKSAHGEVSIEYQAVKDEGGKVALTVGASKTELAGLDVSEFPHVETAAGDPLCRLKAANLRHALATIEHAASHDQSRFVLGGVLLSYVNEGLVQFVATDGRRLACASVLPYLEALESADYILPMRAVVLLLDVLKKVEGEATVSVVQPKEKDGRPQVVFALPNSTVVRAYVLEGRYPNWKQVVPKSYKVKVECSPELAAEVKRATRLVYKHKPGIKLTFHADHCDLVVRNTETDAVSRATVPVAANCQEPLEVCYNVHYLDDALSALMPCDWLLTDACSGSTLKPRSTAPMEFEVVMPVAS